MESKICVCFETPTLECRTWDSSRMNEDVATGSAAGPLCAYLVRNGFAKPDQVINISQGKYIGRPSIIKGWVEKRMDMSIFKGMSFFSEPVRFLSSSALPCFTAE
jgi:trans-2,3-dihydro-3-hydroxyanthranilate isomerase